MSEPQTPHSIDDVLSSIRRLVSHGERGPRPHAPPGMEAGALVLTPSLRIASGGDTEDETFPDESAPDGTLILGAAEADDGWSPDQEAEDASSTESEEAWSTEADAEPNWPDPEEVDALAQLDGVEAEASRGDEPADAASAADDTAADEIPAEADDGEEAAVPGGAADDPTGVAERSVLEATIAELEDAVTRQIDEWEPDGSEPEAEVDWSVAETGAAAFFSSRLRHRPNGSAPPLTLVNPEPPASAGAAAVDRAVLRQLVVEVVRAELEGELGERITRNVRRLVRREVAQALAIRDLD